MSARVFSRLLVAAGVLFWALGGTPTQHATHSETHRHAAYASGHGYDYYVVLRWVVCGVGGLGAFRAVGFGKTGWAWALGIGAPRSRRNSIQTPGVALVPYRG